MTKWKVTLTPISPIHIGDGEILDPTEYIAKDGYVYYLNQVTFVSYLLAQGNDDLKQALDSAEMEKIIRILADNFDAENKLHWKSRTKVTGDFCSLWRENLSSIRNSQQLHRFIRNNASDLPFIPGSSIKGAIRTAILAELAEDENKFQKINQAQNDRKFNAQTAEAILLDKQNNRGLLDISNDPFKYLKVSDAVFRDEDLFLDTIQRYGMSDNDLPVNYEMIKPETDSMTFNITVEDQFTPVCDDIVYSLNYFNKKLAIKETEWLKSNVNQDSIAFRSKLAKSANSAITSERKCVIRLGFGTGHWGMTLHQYWKTYLKTKALWKNQLLGWAALQFEEI